MGMAESGYLDSLTGGGNGGTIEMKLKLDVLIIFVIILNCLAIYGIWYMNRLNYESGALPVTEGSTIEHNYEKGMIGE